MLAIALFYTSSDNVFAQSPHTEIIGDRALIATGLNQNAVTIINRDEIEKSGKSNIIDILQSVSGLYVDQSNGLQASGIVSMRGADPNFTLIMIDGVRMNNPTDSRGGTFDYSSVSLSEIERIEILKGAQSYAYGSSALAGVIDIVTKSFKKHPFEQNIEHGNRGWLNSSSDLNHSLASTNFSLAANYLDSGNPLNKSNATHKNLSAHINHAFNTKQTIKLISRYSEVNKNFFPDDSGGKEFAHLNDQQKTNEREWVASVNINQVLTDSSLINFRISHLEHKNDNESPGIAPGIRNPFGIPPNQSNSTFRSTQLITRSTTFLNSQVAFNAGLEGNFERGKESGSINFAGIDIPNQYKIDRDTYALFGQLQYSFNNALTVDLGSRVDVPEDYSTRYSPQLAATYWSQSLNTTFRFDAAAAFKLPSFFALGNSIVGNPSLKPETSNNLSLSTASNFYDQRLLIESSIFTSEYKNLIDFIPIPIPLLINRSKVNIYGGELNFRFNIHPKLSLQSNVSYSENKIKSSDEELLNRPNWQSFIQTNWQPKDSININIQTSYVGTVRDSSIPTGEVKLDNYVRVDAAITWSMHPKATLRGAIDNVFDEHYDLAIGVPANGITPRVNLSFQY